MHILSVDDRADNRYLMESLAKGHGHRISSANNGREALQILHAESVDLIICDILMPVMDGFQLCREVKADPSLCHIPVVIYTATYTGPQDEAFALKIGASKFIIKPCEPLKLITIIEELYHTRTNEPQQPIRQENGNEVLKLYNERLVRNLEMKTQQLEKEAAARHLAETSQKAQENRYRSLYNSIRDALLISEKDGRIIDCNKAFTDMFGYHLPEISGKRSELVAKDENEYQRLLTRRSTLPHDRNMQNRMLFHRKDGSVFPGEINVFQLHNDEQTLSGYISLIRDITDKIKDEENRRSLEAQLYQSQRMESIGRLAGGVAHDYNNMLSVILGYAQIANKLTTPGSQLNDYLLQIIDAAKRTTKITRKLLGFARRQTSNPQIINLNQRVDGILRMLRQLIGEDITLSWHPTSEIIPVVKIDPSQIDQILTNLCVNSRDAISGVGTISIKTEFVSFASGQSPSPEHGDGQYVTLSVQDNGCGMAKEEVSRIFDPFYTTKEPGQGTGLGLATVYGIVRQHDGFIDVISEPNRGTTFTIFLPLHNENPLSEEEAHIEELSGRHKESILVVEDEESVLKLTRLMLSDLGYTVFTANTPSMAIQFAHNHPGQIHLLLTDVIMPEMSGKDLALLLKNFRPDMKCLFMSGYAENVIDGHDLKYRETHFLQKPFSQEELSKKIISLLSKT